MARVAVDHSHIDGDNPISGNRLTLQFKHHHCVPNLLNSNPLSPNKCINSLSNSNCLEQPQKKQASTIQRNIHKQFYNPTEQAIVLSQSTSLTGAHLMQPSSEACEGSLLPCLYCQKIDASASGCCQPVQFCPNKKCGRCNLQQTSRSETAHCYDCRYG